MRRKVHQEHCGRRERYALICYSAIIQLHNNTIAQVRNDTIEHVRNYTIAQVHNYSFAQLQNCRIAQLHYYRLKELSIANKHKAIGIIRVSNKGKAQPVVWIYSGKSENAFESGENTLPRGILRSLQAATLIRHGGAGGVIV
jgi:hypothetical protein